MLWCIQCFPLCTHHVFLSHCREDREWLVLPVYEELRRRGTIPWLDQHDYPYGRTSFEALRDGVLKSRHVVFLVTQAMLTQPRGWPTVELVWADLLQENLRESGGSFQTVMLPLFFLECGDMGLRKSAWQPVQDRGVFHRPENGNPIAWTVEQISRFVLRESQRGLDNGLWLQQDSRARARLMHRPGLIDRIVARHPATIAVA